VVVKVEDLSQGNLEGTVTSFEFKKREKAYIAQKIKLKACIRKT
jgi:hypothetical protein